MDANKNNLYLFALNELKKNRRKFLHTTNSIFQMEIIFREIQSFFYLPLLREILKLICSSLVN